MTKNRLELVAFLVLFAGISLLTFFVFQPFFHILMLATVLTVLLDPFYGKLCRVLGNRRSAAALLTVVIVFIFIIAPLLFLGFRIFVDTQAMFLAMKAGGYDTFLTTVRHAVETPVRYFLPDFSFNISDYFSKLLSFISDNFAVLLSQTAYIAFETFFLLFAFFFFLRDGKDMFASLIALSPFEKNRMDEIMRNTRQTIHSVIRGTLFVGFIRWILLAGGFYIFGIPDPLLWATLGGIIAAIPGLGTPFAIVPALIYLFVVHSIGALVGLAILGVLIILCIDNLLTTYFFGKGLDISPIFVLFSILGGIIFFGPLGFIFGPIILSLFISVLNIYKIFILKNTDNTSSI